jgi:hypothetical protein
MTPTLLPSELSPDVCLTVWPDPVDFLLQIEESNVGLHGGVKLSPESRLALVRLLAASVAQATQPADDGGANPVLQPGWIPPTQHLAALAKAVGVGMQEAHAIHQRLEQAGWLVARRPDAAVDASPGETSAWDEAAAWVGRASLLLEHTRDIRATTAGGADVLAARLRAGEAVETVQMAVRLEALGDEIERLRGREQHMRTIMGGMWRASRRHMDEALRSLDHEDAQEEDDEEEAPGKPAC